MNRVLNALGWRKLVILVFVCIAIGKSAAEIAEEIAQGQAMVEMADDFLLFFAGLILVVMIAAEYWHQQNALTKLRTDLENSRGKLAQVDAESASITDQYRLVMQKQFDAWALTDSEQDVVLALLKGLSFREVAEIRDTREKTVRQQAANVYKKAGVAGRHELAGWFFEDLLQSPRGNGSELQ